MAPDSIIMTIDALNNRADLLEYSELGAILLTGSMAPSRYPDSKKDDLDLNNRADLLEYDDNQILQFLAPFSHYPDYKNLILEFRYIHGWKTNVGYGGRNRAFSCYRTIDQIEQFDKDTWDIFGRAQDGYNVYIGVQPRYAKLAHNKAANSNDISKCYCLYMDADDWTIDNLDENLLKYDLPQPTNVVTSGNGLHLRWYLNTPVNPRLGLEAMKYLIQIKMNHTRIAEEKVYDTARVLRLPNTINFKDPYNPKRVKLLRSTGSYYDIEGILRCTPYFLENPHVTEFKWTPPTTVPPTKKIRENARKIPAQKTPAQTITPKSRKSDIPDITPKSRKSITCALDIPDIIARAPIQRPGERNHAISVLVARIRATTTRVTPTQLETIHSKWFQHYQSKMSGKHNEQSSFAEFMYCWEHMPVFSSGRTGVEFQLSSTILEHPLAYQLSGPKRKLANIIYTKSMSVDFNPQGYYLSVRDAGMIVNINKAQASQLLKELHQDKFIIRTKPGSLKGYKAAYFTIPIELQPSTYTGTEEAVPANAGTGGECQHSPNVLPEIKEERSYYHFTNEDPFYFLYNDRICFTSRDSDDDNPAHGAETILESSNILLPMPVT